MTSPTRSARATAQQFSPGRKRAEVAAESAIWKEQVLRRTQSRAVRQRSSALGAFARTVPPRARSPGRVVQRQPRVRVKGAREVRRRPDEHHLERGADMGLEQVAAAGAAVAPAYCCGWSTAPLTPCSRAQCAQQ